MLESTPGGREVVHFAVGAKYCEASRPAPERTLLHFLREDMRKTGTKEGCAEGDCGACAVVVCSLENGEPHLRSVNACLQPLASLDGMVVLTVEDQAEPSGAPSILQTCFVEHHASQCGFCTPGFVMASAAYLARRECASLPSSGEVATALTGNLCRCTGYRPIVAAVRDAAGKYQAAGRTVFDEPGLKRTLDSLRTRTEQPLEWHENGRAGAVPRDENALRAAMTRHPDATLIAGATDVGVTMSKHYARPAKVIYLSQVESLQKIVRTSTTLEIGAAASWAAIQTALRTYAPDLEEALERFASPLIRNTGTMGGNLVTGSPVGDAAPILMALGARLVIGSTAGQEREIDISAFHTGYRQTCLRPGEYLARIVIPSWDRENTCLRAYKISRRRDQDISAVMGAFFAEWDGSRIIKARFAYGGMAATPVRARHAESVVIGQWLDAQIQAQACAALQQDTTPRDDLRGSAAYREQIAQALLQRFFDAVSDSRQARPSDPS
jgi:xanthine dehydrogenase small subunit